MKLTDPATIAGFIGIAMAITYTILSIQTSPNKKKTILWSLFGWGAALLFIAGMRWLPQNIRQYFWLPFVVLLPLWIRIKTHRRK